MARPEVLTDNVRMFITNTKSGNPELKAKEIIEEVKNYLIDNYPKNGRGWTREEIEPIITNEFLPKSAIVKYNTKVNKELKKLREVDNPWHLDVTLELPSEDVAAIFKVQKWLEKAKDNPLVDIRGWNESYTDNRLTTTVWPLTIREALWISKLYKVEDTYSRGPFIEDTYRLWKAAKVYADYQRLCEIAETDFNTSRLDDSVRHGNIGEVKQYLFSEYNETKDGE